MAVVRYICFDLGDKRTGVAISDSLTRIVTPGEVLEVPAAIEGGLALINALLAQVHAMCGSNVSQLICVVGLPLIEEGKEGPRAKVVRKFMAKFAQEYHDRLGVAPDVRYQDETLTSAQADWSMQRSGMTRGEKKQRRDALAAAIILRDYIENAAAQFPQT